jgi:hypothetical protein
VASIEFLTIYAEICLGTVAFMAIVATLRQTTGGSLSAYQYLITRYFVDVGLIHLVVALSGIALISFYGDETAAWRIMAWLIIAINGFYVPYYIAKRRRINAPWSLTPITMTAGAVATYINIVLSLAGVTEISIPSAVATLLTWALVSMVGIFLVFLGTFMKVEGD